MSESLNNLIDFSQLIRSIQNIHNNLKNNDLTTREILASQSKQEAQLLSTQKEVRDIQLLAKGFTQGLLTITKIEEKLASWSDRFRILEENNYNLQSKFVVLEDHFESQIEKIKKSTEFSSSQLRLEIEQSSQKTEETFTYQTDKINEALESLSRKVQKTEERSGIIRRSSESPVVADKPSNQHEEALMLINSRLATLEIQLSIFSNDVNKSNVERLVAKEKAEESQSQLTSFRQDLDNKLSAVIKEIHTPQAKKPLPISTPNKLERTETFTYSTEFTTLEKKVTLLDKKLIDFQKRHSMITAFFPRLSQPSIPANIEENLSDSSSDEPNPLVQSYDQLVESVEKIQKALPLMMYKSELEEILVQYSKKIKDSRKVYKETEDYGPKISELEQRINGLWKVNTEIQEQVAGFKERVKGGDMMASDFQETARADMEMHLIAIKGEIFEVLDSFKGKLKYAEVLNEAGPIQNEQYFRSMLLALKSEINSLKTEVEYMRAKPAPLTLEPAFELPELQEPLQIGMLQSILKQHDAAIRILTNKSLSVVPIDRNTIAEDTDHLSHLEDLKKEMKEILTKQEETKKISAKDLEIIQNILISLDSKIGREDLGQMAEKNELHKIYRMLKRRIDELAEVILRKESEPREEAFFSKKRLNTECASCGQIVPEKGETRAVYENWNRFPSKTPISGAGFSRILNSLVQSPTGGLMLPKSKSRLSIDETRPTKTQTVKSKSRKISSRIQTASKNN